MEVPFDLGYLTQSICLIDPLSMFKGDKLLTFEQPKEAFNPSLHVVSREISVSPPPGAVFGFRQKRTVSKSLGEWEQYDLHRSKRPKYDLGSGSKFASETFIGNSLLISPDDEDPFILHGIHPR